MILKYIIEYISNDNSYATLIKELAHEGGYKVSIVRANGAIIIYIDEEEDEIKAFFTTLGERLPLSVYVGQSRVEEAASFPEFAGEFQKTKLWSMCFPSQLIKVVDENSADYLNPFVESSKVWIDDVCFESSTDSFKAALGAIATKIADGYEVSFENENGKFSLCKNAPSAPLCESIMCIDLNKIAVQYKVPNVALFALSSMERPFVTVTTSDNGGVSKFVRLTLASDLLLLSLAKILGDKGFDRLYFTDGINSDSSLRYTAIAHSSATLEVLIHKDRKLFLSDETYDSTILPIEEDSLVAYFGDMANGSFLAIRPTVHSKELLTIKSFEKCATEEVAALDENGSRLLENFEKKFAGILGKCDELSNGYDFEKFINLCAVVLGCQSDEGRLAYLVALAAKNQAPAGVKIDFILETEGAPTLNLVKSFRTLLSYKLADVEDTILAYSIFESFADFISILSDEARKGFDAKELVLCGGMFYSQILSDRVFTKARNIRVSSAYIPQILVEKQVAHS